MSAGKILLENQNNWGEIGKGRRSGALVPLFSVYSRRSAGIGDLEDLKLLVDFCEKTGNSILQLLPMNEVGDNFCPYESVSSFALEPAYAAIETNSSLPPILPPPRQRRVRLRRKGERYFWTRK